MARWSEKPHLHFVGIGGIGMSGIAEVFYNQGFPVSGSDAADGETTRRLRSLGLTVHVGHRAEHVGSASVVIISSAVKADNPEVLEAKARRIPVVPRAEMLGELMRGKIGIALAGTHGKTTSTSLMATICTHAGYDPTAIIGGKVDALGGNAKLGKSEWVVAEADESDGSFLQLPATFAVVTNIDNDHLDHFGSLENLDEAFLRFLGGLPFYGLAAVCGDDPGVRRILSRITKPYVTYGWGPEWDFWAENAKTSGMRTTFSVHSKKDGKLGEIALDLPGKHNVLNALGTVAIALRIGIPFPKIAEALASFRGVKRRFETRYHDETRGIRIVDDYGHHPTEIQATLQAARAFWDKGRIIAIFQPHRYSRTLHCEAGFLAAFGNADDLILTDIYAAGESPIPGVTGEGLFQKLKIAPEAPKRLSFAKTIQDAADLCTRQLKDGDLVLCMGAGTITQLPDLIARKIAKA